MQEESAHPPPLPPPRNGRIKAHYRNGQTRVSTLVTNDDVGKIASQLASTSMALHQKYFPDGYGFRAAPRCALNDIALAPLGGSLFVVDSFASRVETSIGVDASRETPRGSY